MKKALTIILMFFSVLSFAQEQDVVLTETHEIKEVSSFVRHKVKRKETLFGIAKRYGMSIDELCKLNNISRKQLFIL